MIDLRTPLSLADAFRFPLQRADARREVTIGAVLLVLLPGVGWLLNMGHRVRMVHRMLHGEPAWPAWPAWSDRGGWWALLRDGGVTFAGMVLYHAPGSALLAVGAYTGSLAATVLGAILWLSATAIVPGYMSHYCVAFDAREVFDPLRATRRVVQGGAAYWHAWGIAASALALSFTGILAFGVGFFWTSVWFWQVAGFSFATVFTGRFDLARAGGDAPSAGRGSAR